MCGIIGIIANNSRDVSSQVLGGLLTLQHRGQDAAGILSFDREYHRFNMHKDLGLVNNVFNQKIRVDNLKGQMAIGHTRYATTGSDQSCDIQPLVTGFPHGLAMAHNGNIVNYHELATSLREKYHHQFLTTNDLEIFLNLFCQELSGTRGSIENLQNAAKAILENAIGAYSIVGILAEHGLFGLRDPNGIRPLILGKKVDKNDKTKIEHILCSETNALNFLGFEYVRDISPGEFIFIHHNGEIFSFRSQVSKTKTAHCMFEWVYFSNAESSLEGRSVYQTRLNLGIELAKEIKLNYGSKIMPDIVCPVPDTSRSAAIAASEILAIPYRECLIKNRYIQRSFILKTDEERDRAVMLKLSPIISEIENKSILLVDDSLVRGTTAKRIIKLLKDHGAREVIFALTCPPLKHGCFYGVDFPDEKKLIAVEKTTQEIQEEIGADELIYLSQEGLKKAIGLNDLCMACLTGKYPTDTKNAKEFTTKRNINRKEFS